MMMTQAMVNLSFGRMRREGERKKSLLEISEMDMDMMGSGEKGGGGGGGKLGRERRGRGPYSRRSTGSRRVRRMALAPDNTTQFLMGDQACLRKNLSNFTIDNSSESEEDFVKKEFCKDYDSQRPVRQKLSKSKLIEEYMMVEKDVKLLEKRYAETNAEEQLKARLGTVDYDWSKGEVAMEPEVAEKIRIFQKEILKMAQENSLLRLENNRLVNENRALASSSSSSSSSSDSDSSDSSSESDSSSDEDEDIPEETVGDVYKDSDSESKRDDTGYESDRSAGSDLVTSSFSTSRTRT